MRMGSAFTKFIGFCPVRISLMLLTVYSIAFAGSGDKKRLLVLTDIGGDPDDQQSMVRLLLYANEFDLEGLIATSVRSGVNPDQIYERIEAYRTVRPNLIKHADGYPTAGFLRSLVKSGAKTRNMTSVGQDKSTEGSKHIISVVDKKDERPVWITVWGAPTDLAQALWDVSHSRSKAELDSFISRIRVYDIAGQDDCGGWICHDFPGIFWLRSVDMFQAISVRVDRPFPPHVTGPNLDTFTTEWVAENVRNHGPLGALYPERKWKYEGDTPAYLHLPAIGLNDPEKITHGGWGGRFNIVKTRNPATFNKRNTEAEKKYHDFEMHTGAKDAWRYKGKTYSSHYASLFRWRAAFQNDFAARMDWSLADSYEKANHNPVAAFDSDTSGEYVRLRAKTGDIVELSASGSSDPDADEIFYHWFHYPEAGDRPYRGKITINNASRPHASFVMPKLGADEEIHIILEVKDSGRPSLYSYCRIVVKP